MIVGDIIRILVKMATKGGVEVCTPIPPGESPNENAENGEKPREKIGLRTVISPDADMMTTVSPDVLNRPELLTAHQEKIMGVMKTLKRFRLLLKSIVYSYGSIAGAYSVFRLNRGEFVHTAIAVAGSVAIGFLAQSVVRKFIRNKIDKIKAKAAA